MGHKVFCSGPLLFNTTHKVFLLASVGLWIGSVRSLVSKVSVTWQQVSHYAVHSSLNSLSNTHTDTQYSYCIIHTALLLKLIQNYHKRFQWCTYIGFLLLRESVRKVCDCLRMKGERAWPVGYWERRCHWSRGNSQCSPPLISCPWLSYTLCHLWDLSSWTVKPLLIKTPSALTFSPSLIPLSPSFSLFSFVSNTFSCLSARQLCRGTISRIDPQTNWPSAMWWKLMQWD